MAALSAKYARALVTGASGGLGHAFCEMLLAEGVEVVGTARDLKRLEKLSGQTQFTPFELDLADTDSLAQAYQVAAKKVGGPFDLVVNNAAFGVFGRFSEVALEQWTAQIRAGLIGSMAIAHLASSSMVSRNRGCLVNVSSIAVDQPLPFMSGYNIIKSGLSALSESLIFETRGRDVTVLDFRPGDYRTSFNQSMKVNSTASSLSQDLGLQRVWSVLEKNLAAAPRPDRAAKDLRQALIKGRSGVVYSGDFFQSVMAPLFSRFAPAKLRRAVAARYFGAA